MADRPVIYSTELGWVIRPTDWADADSPWELVRLADQQRLGVFPTRDEALEAALALEPPTTTEKETDTDA
jgi:hypothetical protein